MCSDYIKNVEPLLVTFSESTIVGYICSPFRYMHDYADNRRVLQEKLVHTLEQYARWTLDDFGLHHFKRFKEKNAVKTWLTKHSLCMSDIIKCSENPLSPLHELMIMSCMPWITTETQIKKTEDSMLRAGTIIVKPLSHHASRHELSQLWDKHSEMYNDALRAHIGTLRPLQDV